MKAEWRLVNLGKKQGSFNTNLDQAIKEEIEQGRSPPTLLFTEWEPTVSIGVIESLEKDVNQEACARHQIEMVRRLSGGNSVYLDDGYIVFSVIAPMSSLYRKTDLTGLCKDMCDTLVTALRNLHIPAEFHPPDNIIIRQGTQIQTIGNSGQRIGPVFYAHGSIRYALKDFHVFLDVLKVNGTGIHEYQDEIRSILGEVITLNPAITKGDIKQEIATCFSRKYNVNFTSQSLTQEEINRVHKLMEEQRKNRWLEDQPHYRTKGICYLFLNGKNLVPSLQPILAYSEPSPPEEGGDIYATS